MRAAGASLVLAIPAAVAGQSSPPAGEGDETVFVDQAPDSSADASQVRAPVRPAASSSVYFPDAITPESVAEARTRAAEQEQLEQAARDNRDVDQVSTAGEGSRTIAQLTDGTSPEVLAQLTEAERQVLLDAVEGTDICERSPDIAALQELCESRIETRSAEFAQNTSAASAEDSLLGGGLDSSRLATLEAAISRLARTQADSSDFSNQVIASVALDNSSLGDNQAAAVDNDPTAELSSETQALIAAIVQQLGGN